MQSCVWDDFALESRFAVGKVASTSSLSCVVFQLKVGPSKTGGHATLDLGGSGHCLVLQSFFTPNSCEVLSAVLLPSTDSIGVRKHLEGHVQIHHTPTRGAVTAIRRPSPKSSDHMILSSKPSSSVSVGFQTITKSRTSHL